MQKSKDSDLLTSGWRGHIRRRISLFKELETSSPFEGDMLFDKARTYLNKTRKFFTKEYKPYIIGKIIYGKDKDKSLELFSLKCVWEKKHHPFGALHQR